MLGKRVRSADGLHRLRTDAVGWSEGNVNILQALFDTPEYADEYEAAVIATNWVTGRKEPSEEVARFRAELVPEIDALRSIRKRAEILGEADAPVRVPQHRPGRSRRVFVVHGHDEHARIAVQELLRRLQLDPVVLSEEPNRGLTIIEKFEQASDVAYAVVLLTPDDRGGPAAVECEALRPRARQNVIFELGYFVARLGRGHVCALHKGDLEIPSDYGGVAYVQMDGGRGWRYDVAKEIKAAGLVVDLNRI